MRRAATVWCGAALGVLACAGVAAADVTGISVSPPSPVGPGTTVTVTVTSSSCPAISLSFGDGPAQVVTAPAATLLRTHQYTATGTFTLTAQGQNGCGGLAQATLVVAVGHVTGIAASPTQATPGTAINFTVSGTQPCDFIRLNFGDGTTSRVAGTTLPLVQSHTYSQPGSFTVVAAGDGVCDRTAQTTVSVQAQGQVTRVDAPAQATTGTQVAISIAGTPPCSAIHVDFGDGAVATPSGSTFPVVQTHTYNQAGTKTIVAAGQTPCTGQAQATISVQAPGQVTGINPPAQTTTGTPVRISIAGTAPCGAISVDFGEGPIITVQAPSFPALQTHTYTQIGTKAIVVAGQTACGGRVQASISVFAPTASGTVDTATTPVPTLPPGATHLPSLPAPLPDLTPDLTGSPISATVGQDVTYEVSTKNIGQAEARGVVTRMQLPREVNLQRIDKITPSTCDQSGAAGAAGGVVTCLSQSIGVGGAAHWRIVARPINALSDNIQMLFGVTVNPTIPGPAISESNTGNNTAGVATTVRSPADLAIQSISVAGNSILSGPTCLGSNGKIVEVQVVNTGPGASGATQVKVAWNAGIGPLSQCGPGTGCDMSSMTCKPGLSDPCFDTCSVPGLFPGQVTRVIFAVAGGGGNLGTATVDPTHALNDPNRPNNTRPVQ